MIDWDEIWKAEKYPMWVMNGEVGKFWDGEASNRFQKMVCSENARSRTMQQVKSLNLSKDDIVLDIGCGVGRLSVPIAKIVKKVYALDISKKMLEYAKKYAESECVEDIEFIQGNWEEFDIATIEKVDVTIAYNSLGVYELRKSLEKINAITRREVYIFTFAGKGEWMDEELVEIIYGNRISFNYSSASIISGLLSQMGIVHETSVEESYWAATYHSVDEAFEDIINMYSIDDSFRDIVKDFIIRKVDRKNGLVEFCQKRSVACIHWFCQ